MLALLIS